MFRSLPPPSIPAPSCSSRVMDPRGTTAKRQKWGRFLTHQRANADQVPLPFVNDMEDTLDEEKGADRVERCVCIEPFLRVSGKSMPVFLIDFG